MTIHLTTHQMQRIQLFSACVAEAYTEWYDNPPMHPTTPYEYAFSECIEGSCYEPADLDYDSEQGFVSLCVDRNPTITARVSIDDWYCGVPLLSIALSANPGGVPIDHRHLNCMLQLRRFMSGIAQALSALRDIAHPHCYGCLGSGRTYGRYGRYGLLCPCTQCVECGEPATHKDGGEAVCDDCHPNKE